MAPYLETVKVSNETLHIDCVTHQRHVQSFADVPVTDAGVDTVAFLEASKGLVGLFGMYTALKRDLIRR